MARRRREERQAQYESAAYQDLQERLGANLRRLREDAGWTQEEAAHECGMSTRLLQRIEAADTNTTLTTLARLVEGLDVDIVDLVTPIKRRRRTRR